MQFLTLTRSVVVWLAYATAYGPAELTHEPGPSTPIQLNHWPSSAAISLTTMIIKNANKGDYAVFDMDNTSYRYDLEEALLPYLENRGILTRQNLDPSLRVVDFKDTTDFTETLYSYCHRLCELDHLVCYPWIAQVWSGFTLRDLEKHVDDLMAHGSTIPTRYWNGDEVVSGNVIPPQIYRGQIELYNALMENGIAVYVVSAAHEELVRMVASDPKYGYNVPPENVIGVTTLLKDVCAGTLTTSRKQIAEGTYNQQANLDLVMHPYLWSPATWYAGKWAAILTYIDQWKRPVLVAGDTPGSDSYMLFHGVDTSKGGIHVWVNQRDDNHARLQEEIKHNVEAQKENEREVTADLNWVVVKPEDIL
jgi:phosphoserine phosphatase